MKNISIAFLASALAILSLVAAPGASAQTATTSLQAQLDLIASLNKQIEALKAQLVSLQRQRASTLAELATTLREGSRGDDVKVLQALLTSDPDIYPEGLITGFFGRATAAAVRRFQKKTGLEQVGNVGPRTLEKLKEKLKEHPVALEDHEDNGKEKRLCAAVPPGHLIAPGWLRKHGGDKPVVPPCQTLPPGIARILEGKIGKTKEGERDDTKAPVISSLTAAGVGASTASISWATDEDTKGTLFYATTSPVVAASAWSVVGGSFSENHALTLQNLTASTTYYYIVVASDKAGNVATSNKQSFTTTY